MQRTSNPSKYKRVNKAPKHCNCNGFFSGIDCIPFFFDDRADTMVFQKNGTAIFPNEPHGINLKKGTIVILTSTVPAYFIHTDLGRIEIDKSTIALIQRELEHFRIVNVSGPDITVTFGIDKADAANFVHVESGREINCIPEGNPEARNQTPADGIARHLLSNSVMDGLQISTYSFDKLKMAYAVLPYCAPRWDTAFIRKKVKKALDLIKKEARLDTTVR